MFFNVLQWWLNRNRLWLQRKKTYFNQYVNNLQHTDPVQAKQFASDVEALELYGQQLQEQLLKTKSWGLSPVLWWRVWGFSSALTDCNESTKSIVRQLLETIVFVGGSVFLVKTYLINFYAVPSGSAEPNLLVGDRVCGIKYPYLFAAPKKGDLIIFLDPRFVYSKSPILRWYQRYIGIPFFGLPAGPECWTKRVIALPGDVVEGKINDQGCNEVYVNGEKLQEPYANPYPVILLKRKYGFIDSDFPLGIFKKGSLRMLYTYDPSKSFEEQAFYKFTEDEIERDWSGKPIIKYADKGDPREDIFGPFKVPNGQIFGIGDNRRNSYDCRHWGFLSTELVLGRVSLITFSLDGTERYWFNELLKNPWDFFTKKIRWSRTMRFVHPFSKLPTS